MAYAACKRRCLPIGSGVTEAAWKTVFAERPKLGPVKATMRASIADLVGLPADAVNVKAKTGERVGHIGRGEAIGCHAVVLIQQIA